MPPIDTEFLRDSVEIARKHMEEGGLWIPVTLDEGEGVILGEPASFGEITGAQSIGADESQAITEYGDAER